MHAQDQRPDPDALLAAAAREAKGRLKVFLGAAPGVGKTWEMLESARRVRGEGREVLIGVVETHGRAGTERQIGDLPILPRRMVAYRGQVLEEFDVDAALALHPELLLVDELAHTNAPGSRHNKRWDRRLGDAERAASGEPERRRGQDHRRARHRDLAGSGTGNGR
jgi:two-component system sensor histidine kinase KdpD